MVCGLAWRCRISRSVKNPCSVAASVLMRHRPDACRGVARPGRAVLVAAVPVRQCRHSKAMAKIMYTWPAVTRSGRQPGDRSQLAPGALRPAVVQPGPGAGDEQSAAVGEMPVTQQLAALLQVGAQRGGCAGVQRQQTTLTELSVTHGQDP